MLKIRFDATLGLCALCLAMLSQSAGAETGPLGWGEKDLLQDMQTDRPDFTEGTQPVQSGHVQFESGYTFSYDSAAESESTHVFPELLARIGIAPEHELRLFSEGYQRTDAGDDRIDGVTDFSVGYKYRFLKQEGYLPDLGVIAEIGLPVGDSGLSSERLEPQIKLLWGYDFNEVALSGNLNIGTTPFDNSDGGIHSYAFISPSYSVGVSLTEELGAYGEYFSVLYLESGTPSPEHYMNGGFTYALTEIVQLDIRTGFGLNSSAGDIFSGVGLSFLY